jgi:hypothetical protein
MQNKVDFLTIYKILHKNPDHEIKINLNILNELF